MKKYHPKNQKLYYIEHYPDVVFEPIELYTWEDANEVAEKSQLLYPEKKIVIREFKKL